MIGPAPAKRIAKHVLLPALFRAGLYRRLLRRYHRHKVLVLFGHRVSPDGPSQDGVARLNFERGITQTYFEELIRFLREEMHPVSLQEIVGFLVRNEPIPDRAVAVTLDDGYRDNYLNAFPILKRHGVPATIFLTAEFVSRSSTSWWDRISEILKRSRRTRLHMGVIKDFLGRSGAALPNMMPLTRLSHRDAAWRLITSHLRWCTPEQMETVIAFLERDLGVDSSEYREPHAPLTWDQIREMRSHGIDFGAHTLTHRCLAHVSPDEFEGEALGSKREIEKQLGEPVTAFAYPYGEVPECQSLAAPALRAYGYRCAFTTDEGYVRRTSDPFTLKRLGITNVPVAVTARNISNILRWGSS